MTSASPDSAIHESSKLWLSAVSDTERLIAMLLASLREHCIARG
jgi:hypothetical protein